MSERRNFNQKRQVCTPQQASAIYPQIEVLAGKLRYNGNPAHKRAPGDFGLDPPAAPRPAKTLCDSAGIFTRERAHKLLREGIARRLVSVQARDGWPQNIWAVSGDWAFEAQHEGNGSYHGYPMPAADPLREAVVSKWKDS